MNLIKKLISIGIFTTIIFVLFLYIGIDEPSPVAEPISQAEQEEIWKSDYIEYWKSNPENETPVEYYECDFDYLYSNYGVEYIRESIVEFEECNQIEKKECDLPEEFYQSYENCKEFYE